MDKIVPFPVVNRSAHCQQTSDNGPIHVWTSHRLEEGEPCQCGAVRLPAHGWVLVPCEEELAD